MLALSAGILRANLLAIDALHGETLVFLFRAELDKCSVHII
jgi:hypothetical protein